MAFVAFFLRLVPVRFFVFGWVSPVFPNLRCPFTPVFAVCLLAAALPAPRSGRTCWTPPASAPFTCVRLPQLCLDVISQFLPRASRAVSDQCCDCLRCVQVWRLILETLTLGSLTCPQSYDPVSIKFDGARVVCADIQHKNRTSTGWIHCASFCTASTS